MAMMTHMTANGLGSARPHMLWSSNHIKESVRAMTKHSHMSVCCIKISNRGFRDAVAINVNKNKASQHCHSASSDNETMMGAILRES